MKYHYVYKTTNILNGKYYIGVHSTQNLDDGYIGSGKALKNAIEKYGLNSFEHEILEFFDDRDSAYERERQLVTEDTINDHMCYNMKLGGNGGWDHIKPRKHSDETREKISAATTGRPAWFKGKTHTEESKQKMRDAKKNLSDDARTNLSNAKKGCNNPNFGKNPSEETREKQRQAMKGFKHTDEVKEKMTAKNRELAQKKYECEHCGKFSNIGNYKRWHGDNCKHAK